MKSPFKNCSECVAFKKCFPAAEFPHWDNENNCAPTCSKPYKGYGNDLVKIENSVKCISLKKAFRLTGEGKISWQDHHEARFRENQA